MKTELQLNLFKGFYGSLIESYVDNNVDQDLCELNLEYSDCDISYNFEGLAKDIFYFAKSFFLDELDFISNAVFKELWSPREYNFSNDKIYFDCEIDKSKFIEWRRCLGDGI